MSTEPCTTMGVGTCKLWLLILLLLPLATTINYSDKDIEHYREKVRRMFYHAYNGYLENAFPLDELKPISCTGQDTWGSFSLTLIDALDTLLIMGNTTEFRRAVELVLKSVTTDANVNVSVFETNIRVVGGLITAHMLSGRVQDMPLEGGWPCDGPLLRLARRMADRLMPAFNTDTGMPYGTVNLKYGVHKGETPVTCTAGVGTFIIEFGALSRLTGDPQYEAAALRALDSLWKNRSPIGLVGNHVNVHTAQWTATDSGIGAGVDSYFEYLAKGAVLFQRPELMRQFREYESAINKHVRKEDWFMWVSMAKGSVSLPIFQSLEAFWPGVLTLLGDVEDARRILMQYSQVVRQYGFPPEFYNLPNSEPVAGRAAFPLRPEMAESLMYMYQATRDPEFLHIGAQMVDAIEHSAKTRCGYATINNVNEHSIEDRMESFFLAETTKYLYLLFDPHNFIHNDGTEARVIDAPDGSGECVIEAGAYVFNTEAHPIDPAMLHCCSERGKMERQMMRDFASNVNLVDVMMTEEEGGKRVRMETPIFEEILQLGEAGGVDAGDEYMDTKYGKEWRKSEIEFEIDAALAPPADVEYVEGEERGEEYGYQAEEEEQEEAEQEKEQEAEAVPVARSSQQASSAGEARATRSVLDSPQVVKQVADMLRRARVLDEERREKGETTDVAEQLKKALGKIKREYKDVVRRASELESMSVADLQRRLLRGKHAAAIMGVPTALCQSCCFPLDHVGESVAARVWQAQLYKNYVYPSTSTPFSLGPVCLLEEAPREQDNYNNDAPDLSHIIVDDDMTRELLAIPISYTEQTASAYGELTRLQYYLLSAPPLPFTSKFTGAGQVATRKNSTG